MPFFLREEENGTALVLRITNPVLSPVAWTRTGLHTVGHPLERVAVEQREGPVTVTMAGPLQPP